MRPRSPHGVVTVRSQSASQRLKLIESAADPSGLPAIQNLLGADVKLVLFRTTAGLFLIENLPANATAVGKRVDTVVGRNAVMNAVRTASPRIVNNDARATSSNSGFYNWGDEVRGIESLRNPIVEAILDSDNTYVAMLEHFPLAAEQIEDVEYKLQLHVIHGHW
jgi:hypothetical protein